MKIGILGAGHIAGKVSRTLSRMASIETYAVASRSLEKAEAFCREFGYERAYGSYEELVADSAVELVYVATPHNCHFANCKLAIEAGKPVICEKSFMMTAQEAEEIFSLAEARGVFITEAIWTRYMPLSRKVNEIIASGAIGKPQNINASLCYAVSGKERVSRPELGGGALLDLGVYCLNFVRMYFEGEIRQIHSWCTKNELGVDTQDNISIEYADGRVANIQAGTLCVCDRHGVISGSEGYIKVENVNCPELVGVYDKMHQLKAEYRIDQDWISGFEYEFNACVEAIEKGLTESTYMPHKESVEIMKLMDCFRDTWGVPYRF